MDDDQPPRTATLATDETPEAVPVRDIDVVVIGGGPGGEDVTLPLLDAGLSVALVEKELIGGECFNWACVPSKAMLRPGHALTAARRLPGAAEATHATVDARAVFAQRDELVNHHDDTTLRSDFAAAGAEFVRGHARLAGPREVAVETHQGPRRIRARTAVVLATGSTVSYPDIPGLREARPWTNREATSSHDAPRRLAVLGAGAVGLEMAQAWRSLGCDEVTVLDRGDGLLPHLEPFVGPMVAHGLEESGVRLRHHTRLTRVERTRPGGEVTLHLDDGTTMTVDELLVATGKRPTTTDVGLEVAGLTPGAFVDVDDTMLVPGTDWLYAVGDVNGRALLTHQASYHARVAAASIVARDSGEPVTFTAEADHRAVPQVIFTDPQVAAVGLTQQAARARGLTVRVVTADFASVLGAPLHAKGYDGRAGIVVDVDTKTLVGATFVGQDVADMLHAATIAITGRLSLDVLRHAVPTFPTLSEVWLELYASAGTPEASADDAG